MATVHFSVCQKNFIPYKGKCFLFLKPDNYVTMATLYFSVCQKNFIPYKGKCFLFLKPDNYLQAAKHCHHKGGDKAHLAHFKTQQDLKRLQDFVQSMCNSYYDTFRIV